MSHHYSGPDFGFPHGDARLDLTDLYAFPKPGEADKSILIMNVHPSAVVNPPGSTTRVPFASEALYELKIDTNGDAVADIAYRVRFSSSADGPQNATVRRVEGAAGQHLCAEPCNFAYRDRASQGVQAPGLFMKEDVMNRLEKVLYTAKAHTTGGRAGVSRSSHGRPPGQASAAGRP